MTALTPEEQLMLEFVNRARLDPAAEAARVNLPSLNQSSGTIITADPKQPLAGSNLLGRVAQNHNDVVWNPLSATPNNTNLAFNPHTGTGDGTPDSRMTAAGYIHDTNVFHWPENFAFSRTSFALTQSQMQTQLQTSQNDLFFDDPNKMGSGAFHRLAMLDPNAKEMGIDVKIGTAQGLNQVSIFENFSVSSTSSNSFLTGVVYNDSVIADDFYSLSEGLAGVTARVTNVAGAEVGRDVTGTGGGWSVSESGGTFKVTFSGGGVATQAVTVAAGNLNAKVDLVNGNRIDSSVSATLAEGGDNLRLLGIGNINGTGNDDANVITGNKGANLLTGNRGDDTISGGSGKDTINGGGGKDTILGGSSSDNINGQAGRDFMTGGTGNDDFIFTALSSIGNSASTRDVIKDFVHGVDDIVLSALDAKIGAGKANDAFTFVAAKVANGADFTAQGQIHWFQINAAGTANDKTIIEGNLDGNKSTQEFQIELKGLVSLSVSDFIL